LHIGQETDEGVTTVFVTVTDPAKYPDYDRGVMIVFSAGDDDASFSYIDETHRHYGTNGHDFKLSDGLPPLAIEKLAQLGIK